MTQAHKWIVTARLDSHGESVVRVYRSRARRENTARTNALQSIARDCDRRGIGAYEITIESVFDLLAMRESGHKHARVTRQIRRGDLIA